MAFLSYQELGSQMMSLYREERYAEARDLAEAHAAAYPEHSYDVCFWRTCLNSRAGDPDRALAAFAQALQEGHWYSDPLLADPDLDSLRELPEFQRLVKISTERWQAAQTAETPARITLEPAAGGGAPALLIALHGNNSNAEDSADHWRPATEQGWTVMLPQSLLLSGPSRRIWNDLEADTQLIRQHQQELGETMAADPTHTILGGFSMGGGRAVWLSLTGTIPVAGFIAVGPWLPNVAELRPYLESGAGQNLRGYIVVGDADEACMEYSRIIVSLMQEYGLACELEIHPGLGHTFPDTFAGSLDRAIRFIERR